MWERSRESSASPWIRLRGAGIRASANQARSLHFGSRHESEGNKIDEGLRWIRIQTPLYLCGET
jgi:hypothetical protein